MLDDDRKLTAIYNFGVLAGKNPWLTFLMGYLAGQVHRVFFVESLKDAEISVNLSVRRSAIWPHEPFKAKVRGVSMPNTLTLVRAIDREDTPICVSLDFDRRDETSWYQDILLPDVSFAKDPKARAQEESDAMWEEINRTLDIYKETRALAREHPKRQEELAYYLSLAENRMKSLSDDMEKLNLRMKKLSLEDGQGSS